jgi:hypothetical protein
MSKSVGDAIASKWIVLIAIILQKRETDENLYPPEKAKPENMISCY